MKTISTYITVAAIGVAAFFTHDALLKKQDIAATERSVSQQSKTEKRTGQVELSKDELAMLEKIRLEIEDDKLPAESLADLENSFDIAGHELEAEGILDESEFAWAVSDTTPIANSISLNDKIQTKEPVKFNPELIAAVSVGDTITLPLPGNERYQAIVDHVEVAANGETSWTGYLEGQSSEYPVIFTIGEKNSFATITTPNGLYSMEAVKSSGWVYKTPDLVDLVDPDEPDSLAIDHNHDHASFN